MDKKKQEKSPDDSKEEEEMPRDGRGRQEKIGATNFRRSSSPGLNNLPASARRVSDQIGQEVALEGSSALYSEASAVETVLIKKKPPPKVKTEPLNDVARSPKNPPKQRLGPGASVLYAVEPELDEYTPNYPAKTAPSSPTKDEKAKYRPPSKPAARRGYGASMDYIEEPSLDEETSEHTPTTVLPTRSPLQDEKARYRPNSPKKNPLPRGRGASVEYTAEPDLDEDTTMFPSKTATVSPVSSPKDEKAKYRRPKSPPPSKPQIGASVVYTVEPDFEDDAAKLPPAANIPVSPKDEKAKFRRRRQGDDPPQQGEDQTTPGILDEKARYRQRGGGAATATDTNKNAVETTGILNEKETYRRRSAKQDEKKKRGQQQEDGPAGVLDEKARYNQRRGRRSKESEKGEQDLAENTDESDQVRPGAEHVRGDFGHGSSDVLDYNQTTEKVSVSTRQETLVTAHVVNEDETLDEEERKRIWDEAQKQAADNLRDQIYSEAVVGEAEVIDEEAEKRTRRRIITFGVCMLIVAVIAISVGITVGQRGGETIVIEATPAPSVSMMPSQSPTIVNDACVNAIPVTLDGAVVSGSTVTATEDSFPRCGQISLPGSGGLWYSFEGTGTFVKASTCPEDTGDITTFDTQIVVFSGPCGEFECVDGNDQFCGDQSQVTWFAQLGVTYQICVFGYIPPDFGLSDGFGAAPSPAPLTGGSSAPPAITPPPGQDNGVPSMGEFGLSISNAGNTDVADLCLNADQQILEVGEARFGVTTNATFDIAPVCGDAVNTGPGVFYAVIGTGDVLTAQTCLPATNFDTQVSVFSGSCDSLMCVGGSDDACGLQSGVAWQSEPGETYFVLVHGFGGATGVFTLNLFVANDDCVGTEFTDPLVVDGDAIFGSTEYATIDDAEQCETEINGAGLWYTVLGTGTTMTVDTCDMPTEYDTKINVYAGGCSSLKCIDGNDDSCGMQSAVTWDSAPNTTYYILVHGARSTVGNFTLRATS